MKKRYPSAPTYLVQARIPEELMQLVEQVAEKRRWSAAQVVRSALETFCEAEK